MDNLPSGWQSAKLGDYIKSAQNGFGRRPNGTESGPIVLRLADVSNRKIDLSNSRQVAMSMSEYEKYKIERGDILFVRVNGSHDFVARSIPVDKDYENVVFNDHLIRVKLKNGLSAQFLNELTNTPYIRSKLLAFIPPAAGGQLTINQESLAQLKIPIPPLPEQRKITEILSTWENTIIETERLIEKLKERQSGLMQRLLTGQVRFTEFSGKWREVQIGKLVKEVKRPIEWDDDATYNLISVRRRSGGLFLREQRKGSEIKTKGMKIAVAGDFLISKMQVVHGASGLTTQKFNGMHISGSYISLVTRDPKSLDIRFFDLLSRTPYFYRLTYLSSYGVHIEKMTFNLKDFLKRTIRIPTSIEEQEKIVAIFEVIEKEIKIEEQKLQALKQQKTGLLQKLLTGQIRVKV